MHHSIRDMPACGYARPPGDGPGTTLWGMPRNKSVRRTIIHVMKLNDPPFPVRKRPPHAPVNPMNGHAIIFLTVCTKNRAPLLANEPIHQILRELWSDASQWRVGSYVLLPDHAHLFVAKSRYDSVALRTWIRWWKRESTRRSGRGDTLWHPNFWDTRVRTPTLYAQKRLYVRENPVRHGLVDKASEWELQGEVFKLALELS
jgi:putative transposase